VTIKDMIYKASSSFTETLLEQPETGMGYQLIEAKRPDRYSTQKFIVYNAELIIDLNENFQENKKNLLNEGYVSMFRRSDYLDLSLSAVLSRQELKFVRMLYESSMNERGRSSGKRGADDNPPVPANGKDIFVRLSAYENDRRIDIENKCLLNGTYTTTMEDYLNCKRYNDAPIDRYALPNNEKIKWAFHVQPKSYDEYQLGTVQPANGHNGGGIEAFFKNGTSNDTYLKKGLY